MGEASPQTHKQGCLCLSLSGIHIKILSFFPSFLSLALTLCTNELSSLLLWYLSRPFFPDPSYLFLSQSAELWHIYIYSALVSLSFVSVLTSVRALQLIHRRPRKCILSRVSSTEQYYYHHILITHYRRKKSRFLSALSQWRWWDICLFVECLAIYIQWYSQRAHKRYSLPWKWWCFLKNQHNLIFLSSSVKLSELLHQSSVLGEIWETKKTHCMYPYSMKKCGEEEKRREKRREKYRRALYSRPKIICSSFPNILMRSSIQT